MWRVVVKLVFILFALLICVTPASAALAWCKSDPVVTLNGAVVDVSVAIPLEYVPLVNGPVQYEIQTPMSTKRQVIVNDVGYNGHGSKVIFKDGNGIVQDGQIPTTVRVHIPIDKGRLAPGEVVPAELSVIADDVTILVQQGTSSQVTVDTLITGRDAALLQDSQ